MTSPRRYKPDGSLQQFGNIVIAGSPLKLFRVTEAGQGVIEEMIAGKPVEESRLVDSLLDAGAIHPITERPELSADDVTVVVPVFGQPKHIHSDSIIVDDGSEPPFEEATIRLSENQGPAAARNAGLEMVSTPLVAFVDSDVELPGGWLDALLPHFNDPQVGLAAPRVCSPATSSIGRYESEHSPLDLGDEPGRIRPGTRVSYVPGAAIVCRVEAIRAIGGFDTDLRFGEDVDLAWRLDEAGWRCRFEPRSTVSHAPRPTWGGWLKQRVGYGSSAAPLAQRHKGKLAPIRMSGWSVTAWLLATLGRPIEGMLLGVATSAALVRKLPDIPAETAFRLAAKGNLRAGEQIANAIRRVWWPLLIAPAIRSKAARRILIASVIAARNPMTVVDDLAYSLGLWKGMIQQRTLDPIVPEITSWPGRQTPETQYGRGS